MASTLLNPPHPITVSTNEQGEQELTWSCPATCPTPDECEIIQRLSHSAYSEYVEGAPNGQYLAHLDWLGMSVTHPDGTSISVPSYEPEIHQYVVSALHHDDPNRPLFAITVEERRDGTWVVKNGEITYLDDQCAWSDGWEYSRDWADSHLFDVDTALALAQKAAPDVTVNGTTARQAWTRWDNNRRVIHALGEEAARPFERVAHIEAALAVLAALAPQMDPQAAAKWMTTPRYPRPHRNLTAVEEIALGNGHMVLDNARSTATAPNGA